MQNDIGRVLLSEAEIVAKVKELGDKLTEAVSYTHLTLPTT